MDQVELAQQVDDGGRAEYRGASAIMEGAAREGMTVECKPEGGVSYDEEGIGGGVKDQPRCRFTKIGTSVDAPVLPGDGNVLLCLCNARIHLQNGYHHGMQNGLHNGGPVGRKQNRGIFKRAAAWVDTKIYVYNVTFGLYMLDWWERVLFNVLAFLLLWFLCYTTSDFLVRSLSEPQNAFGPWKPSWFRRNSVHGD